MSKSVAKEERDEGGSLEIPKKKNEEKRRNDVD